MTVSTKAMKCCWRRRPTSWSTRKITQSPRRSIWSSRTASPFIDEIDKITVPVGTTADGGDVSREGVQRDLLPLIEGTTVSTKHTAR